MAIHTYIKYPKATSTFEGWLNIRRICANYGWPNADMAGGGVIGIIECGGGWIASDVALAAEKNWIPLPNVTDVPMDLSNSFGTSDADDEVALDIQVAAVSYSVATGKPATIRMYWTADIAAGVLKAAADGCDVISCSWGDDESGWGTSAAQEMNYAATNAVSKGTLVFAAAGDNDSSDGGSGTNVDCPASCPSVIGCGGTSKPGIGSVESVWNNNPGNADGEGTGGGYSKIFMPMPTWQIGAPTGPGRMVPDVSANADPDTGYPMWLNGQEIIVGGTSAVAPLYAGLFAAFGTKLAVGMVQKLWSNQTEFNDITVGNNGKYSALIGPDACTGIGSPKAKNLSELIK